MSDKSPPVSPETEIDRVYASPFDEFVAVRKEMVAGLVGAGKADAADQIAKLKKPTVSAWVVNQLVRTKELDVQRLLKAGENLEQAQRDLLAGKSGDFETARREEEAAVRLLKIAAKELLPGISAAVLDRVTETLRSATSPEHRAQIKTGRLTGDLDPPGFEAFAAPSTTGAEPAKGKKEERHDRVQILTEQKREANQTAMDLASAAFELDRLAKDAELGAKKARQKADAASAQADAAAEMLARLTAELDDLRKSR